MESFFFHPKLVHLPIALAVLVPPLAVLLAVATDRSWLPRRAWLLAVAAQGLLLVSGLIALRTGEAEEERVEAFVPEAALEAHEEAAEAFVWGSGAALVLMLLPLVPTHRGLRVGAGALAAVGSAAVLGLGVRVGEAGGALVYRHGAAAAYTTAGGPGSTPAAEVPYTARHEREDDDD